MTRFLMLKPQEAKPIAGCWLFPILPSAIPGLFLDFVISEQNCATGIKKPQANSTIARGNSGDATPLHYDCKGIDVCLLLIFILRSTKRNNAYENRIRVCIAYYAGSWGRLLNEDYTANTGGGSPLNPPFPKTQSILPLAVSNQWIFSYTGYDST